MLRLYDHPFSPYAQKVKIALREKGQAFEAPLPQGIGVGGALGEFVEANPRAEVPALIDGDVKLFDSTIILEYIEDKWPTPALLPASPAERARVRMLEEVMDTHYEAINWGLGEVRAFKRATGELAEKIEARAAEQTQGYFTWLERQLGDRKRRQGDQRHHRVLNDHNDDQAEKGQAIAPGAGDDDLNRVADAVGRDREAGHELTGMPVLVEAQILPDEFVEQTLLDGGDDPVPDAREDDEVAVGRDPAKREQQSDHP